MPAYPLQNAGVLPGRPKGPLQAHTSSFTGRHSAVLDTLAGLHALINFMHRRFASSTEQVGTGSRHCASFPASAAHSPKPVCAVLLRA